VYKPAVPIVKTIQSKEAVKGVVNCWEYIYYKIQGIFTSRNVFIVVVK
jgi:hypothetical protein